MSKDDYTVMAENFIAAASEDNVEELAELLRQIVYYAADKAREDADLDREYKLAYALASLRAAKEAADEPKKKKSKDDSPKKLRIDYMDGIESTTPEPWQSTKNL